MSTAQACVFCHKSHDGGTPGCADCAVRVGAMIDRAMHEPYRPTQIPVSPQMYADMQGLLEADTAHVAKGGRKLRRWKKL